MSRVGILGGTFNPIHLGHLRAAEEVAEELELARMLFVPAADPPFKGHGEVALAPARERAGWVEAALRGNPRFELCELELERPGPSYTADTLQQLARELTPAELVFVIGQDAFAELDSWREPETLTALAHFAVMTRPPGGGDLASWLPAGLRDSYTLDPTGESARHRRSGTWVRRIAISALDISATDLRRRVRERRSIRYLVPETVRAAIEACEAYRAAPISPRASEAR